HPADHAVTLSRRCLCFVACLIPPLLRTGKSRANGMFGVRPMTDQTYTLKQLAQGHRPIRIGYIAYTARQIDVGFPGEH
ncbi:hypothetical protein ACC839_38455, partial [Rhizobium ruizarguesonis]